VCKDSSEKLIWGQPRRLNPRRKAINRKITIGGLNVYTTEGPYPNGDLAEVFIDLNKEGSTMRALYNCIAILTSLCIQYGCPVEVLTKFFANMNFEPNGKVIGYPRIKYGQSVIDVIFRLIGIEYLGLEEYADDTKAIGDTINRASL